MGWFEDLDARATGTGASAAATATPAPEGPPAAPGPLPLEDGNWFERLVGPRQISWSQDKERNFRTWYADRARRTGVDEDPDHPLHKYDYRMAFLRGDEPSLDPADGAYHWPSTWKALDHPRRVVDGVDTATGERVMPANYTGPRPQEIVNWVAAMDAVRPPGSRTPSMVAEEYPQAGSTEGMTTGEGVLGKVGAVGSAVGRGLYSTAAAPAELAYATVTPWERIEDMKAESAPVQVLENGEAKPAPETGLKRNQIRQVWQGARAAAERAFPRSIAEQTPGAAFGTVTQIAESTAASGSAMLAANRLGLKGPLANAFTAGGIFGVRAYNDRLDELLQTKWGRNNPSLSQLDAILGGISEWATEGLSDAMYLKTFGGILRPGALKELKVLRAGGALGKQTFKDWFRRNLSKETALSILNSLGAEVGTEELNLWLQRGAPEDAPDWAKGASIPDVVGSRAATPRTTWGNFGETALVAGGQSLLMGVPGQVWQTRRIASATKNLSAETANPEARRAAKDVVVSELRDRGYRDQAALLDADWSARIDSGLPITLDKAGVQVDDSFVVETPEDLAVMTGRGREALAEMAELGPELAKRTEVDLSTPEARLAAVHQALRPFKGVDLKAVEIIPDEELLTSQKKQWADAAQRGERLYFVRNAPPGLAFQWDGADGAPGGMFVSDRSKKNDQPVIFKIGHELSHALSQRPELREQDAARLARLAQATPATRFLAEGQKRNYRALDAGRAPYTFGEEIHEQAADLMGRAWQAQKRDPAAFRAALDSQVADLAVENPGLWDRMKDELAAIGARLGIGEGPAERKGTAAQWGAFMDTMVAELAAAEEKTVLGERQRFYNVIRQLPGATEGATTGARSTRRRGSKVERGRAPGVTGEDAFNVGEEVTYDLDGERYRVVAKEGPGYVRLEPVRTRPGAAPGASLRAPTNTLRRATVAAGGQAEAGTGGKTSARVDLERRAAKAGVPSALFSGLNDFELAEEIRIAREAKSAPRPGRPRQPLSGPEAKHAKPFVPAAGAGPAQGETVTGSELEAAAGMEPGTFSSTRPKAGPGATKTSLPELQREVDDLRAAEAGATGARRAMIAERRVEAERRLREARLRAPAGPAFGGEEARFSLPATASESEAERPRPFLPGRGREIPIDTPDGMDVSLEQARTLAGASTSVAAPDETVAEAPRPKVVRADAHQTGARGAELFPGLSLQEDEETGAQVVLPGPDFSLPEFGRWSEETRAQLKDAAQKAGVPYQEWLKYLDDLELRVAFTKDAIAEIDPDLIERFPFAPKARGLYTGAVRETSGYDMSFDASGNCTLRLPALAYLNAVVDELERRKLSGRLTALEREIILEKMVTAGIPRPCVICYVETRRALRQEYAGKYTDFFTEGKLPEQVPAGMKDPDWLAVQKKWKGKVKANQIDQTVFIDQARWDEALADPKHNIHKFRDLYQAINNVATMNAAAVFGNVPYEGQYRFLSPQKVRRQRMNGGLRFYSMSDFLFEHAVDLQQAVYDASLAGASIHMYTKQPSVAKLLADTGVKINLSLVPVLKKDGTYGEWVGQSFPWSQARKMAAENPNIGITMLVTSIEQAQWAMKQDWIHYILPWHRSGMIKGQALEMARLQKWHNFESVQSVKKPPEPPKRPERGEEDYKAKLAKWKIAQARWEAKYEKNGRYARWKQFEKEYIKRYGEKERGELHWRIGWSLDGRAATDAQIVEMAVRDANRYGIQLPFDAFLGLKYDKAKGRYPAGVGNPGYAKFLKDYGRTDTPQTVVRPQFDHDEYDRLQRAWIDHKGYPVKVSATLVNAIVEEIKIHRKGGRKAKDWRPVMDSQVSQAQGERGKPLDVSTLTGKKLPGVRPALSLPSEPIKLRYAEGSTMARAVEIEEPASKEAIPTSSDNPTSPVSTPSAGSGSEFNTLLDHVKRGEVFSKDWDEPVTATKKPFLPTPKESLPEKHDQRLFRVGKVVHAASPEGMGKTEANKVRWDRRKGLGTTTPNDTYGREAAEVGVRGFVKLMTPRQFLELASNKSPGVQPRAYNADVERLYNEGASLAPPVLGVSWYKEGGYWKVFEHEGRSRADLAGRVNPDEPMPVSFLPIGMRAGELTGRMRQAPIKPQNFADPLPKKGTQGQKYSLPEPLRRRGLKAARVAEHIIKYWPAGGKPAEDILGVTDQAREYLQRVERAWWESHRQAAAWLHPLTRAAKNLSRSDRRWVRENFLRTYEEQGTGAAWPSPAVGALAEAWRDVNTEIGQKAGEEIPTFAERDPETYVPHRLTEEGRAVLQRQAGEEWDALVEVAAVNGIDISVLQGLKDAPWRQARYGSIDYARVAELPWEITTADGRTVKILETDPEVLFSHVRNAARRLSVVQHFETDEATEAYLDGVAHNLVGTGALTQEKAREAIQRIWKRLQGQDAAVGREVFGEAHDLWQAVDSVVAALNLSGAVLGNLVGGHLPESVRMGFGPTVRAFKEAYTTRLDDPSIEDLHALVDLEGDLLQALQSTETLEGRVAKGAGKFLAGTGFVAVNRRINFAVARAMQRQNLRLMLEAVRTNKRGTWAKFWGKDAGAAQRYLTEELRFSEDDVERMALEGPTDADLARAIGKELELVNAMNESPGSRPKWVAHPIWRMAFAYSTFIRKMYDTTKFAAREAKAGNVRPLATLLFAGAPTAAAMAALKNWLKDREPEEKGKLEWLAETMFEVGALGLAGAWKWGIMRLGDPQANFFSDIFEPPHLETASKIGEGFAKAMKQHELKPIWKGLTSTASGLDIIDKQATKRGLFGADYRDRDFVDRLVGKVYLEGRKTREGVERAPLDPIPSKFKTQSSRELVSRLRERYSDQQIIDMIRERKAILEGHEK